MKFNKKIFLIFAFLSIGYFAFCHPHVFFTSSEEFVFEDNQIVGCWLEWTFDSYFSADQIFYYDWDGSNHFDEKETAALYENAFSNLQNFNYFTFIRQGAKRTTPKTITNFSAWLTDGLLTYKFYIDLSYLDNTDFYFAVYDYTFFCDIRYPENSISFNKINTELPISYNISQNKEYPVYYDPWGAADDNSIYDKWRPGLETYYPMEIHVFYEKK